MTEYTITATCPTHGHLMMGDTKIYLDERLGRKIYHDRATIEATCARCGSSCEISLEVRS